MLQLPDTFIQCHKSYIVNTKKITSVDFSNNVIFLNDNVDCKCFIGPKYKNKIMEVFNYANFSDNLDSNDDTE